MIGLNKLGEYEDKSCRMEKNGDVDTKTNGPNQSFTDGFDVMMKLMAVMQQKLCGEFILCGHLLQSSPY